MTNLPPSNSRVDTVFNAMLKLNLGRWAEYRSYKKRTTACHIRKHIMAWTEPNVDYATQVGRNIRGMGQRSTHQGGRRCRN